MTAPAGVDAHYESLERNDEMRERVKVACKTKKKRGSAFARQFFLKEKMHSGLVNIYRREDIFVL